MPILGNPNSPKINIGSKIMFVSAPTICDMVESVVLPVA